MMNPAIENLEAAKLASMIGSQLKAVDRLAIDRPNIPANRININQFVASVTNPNILPSNKFDNTPFGYAKPLPEEIIQQMVPDAVPAYKPPENLQSIGSIRIEPIQENTNTVQNNVSVQQPQKHQKEKPVHTTQYSNLENDIGSIKNSLKNISKTLSDMLVLFRQQIKQDNE